MDRFSTTQMSNGGNFLAVNQIISIQDDYYSLPTPRNAHNYVSIKNRVIVGIDRATPVIFNLPFQSNLGFESEVHIQIDWQEYDQVSQTYISHSEIKIFEVSYSPEQIKAEKDLVVYEFDKGLQVTITILSVNSTLSNGTNTTAIPPNVFVENFLQVERYASLDLVSTLPPLSHSGPNAKNEITINMPLASAVPSAEAFDVEWIFILSHNQELDEFHQEDEEHYYTFDKNATRITTTSSEVTIPLIYPKGILFYRYRARGFDKDNPGEWIYTDWNHSNSNEGYIFKDVTPDPPQYPLVLTSPQTIDLYYGPSLLSTTTHQGLVWIWGYEEHINWQYQQVFAENDKRGQNIQYFDGLLRTRQNVAYNFNDGQRYAIVGQSIYDFQGRPVISVLPVPVPDADPDQHNLDFKASFNQNTNGDAYSWRDFDVDYTDPGNGNRASLTSRMGGNSGASKYYSGSNPVQGTNMDVLPNAYGYPFAQTEYMPDGTGRIRRQGNVGADHQLPGFNETQTAVSGKATYFSYTTPTQEELDRLFGVEVGLAAHYKKQNIVDANGQATVTYFDPAGRVIATALAGDPSNSPNLLPLSSSGTVETITADINNSVRTIDDEMPLYVVSKKIFVANDNSPYTIEYGFTGENVTLSCSTEDFCFDCIYDIEISIMDEYGDEYVQAPFNGGTLGNAIPQTDACITTEFSFKNEDPQVGPPPLVLYLDRGEYTITKRLKLNKSGLNDQLRHFDSLLNTELINCGLLPNIDVLIAEEKALLDYDKCDYTCVKCTDDALAALNTQTINQTEYNEWIADCGMYCDTKTECDILKEALLIDMSPGGQYFSDADIGGSITNIDFTQDGLNEPIGFDRFAWLDANLAAQSSTIFQNLETIYQNVYGSSIVLQSWEDVENNWKPEFAEELIQYHPEYCQYTACMTIETSYEFDAEMGLVDNYTDAQSQGYMNLLNESSVIANYPYLIQDPFFAATPGSAYVASMKSKMLNCFEDPDNLGTYFSIWQAYEAYADKNGIGCSSDEGWFFFRAIYQMKKDEVLKDYYMAQTSCPNSYSPSSNTPAPRKQVRWILDGPSVKSELTFDTDFNLPTTIDPQVPNDQIEEHCDNVCEGYREQWYFELRGCIDANPLLDTSIVLTNLFNVCRKGCDMDHPFGSREINPNNGTFTPRNFKEALGSYWDLNLCNDLNLSWPMGWDHDYFPGANTNDNECACDEDKFKPYRGVACPDEIETEVIDNCLCNEAQNSSLPEFRQALQTLDVPEAAKCKNCIDCNHLREALREYYLAYQNDFFDDPIQDEVRLTTFLNLKFLMNQRYSDYLAFAKECVVLNTEDFDGLMETVSNVSYLDPQYFVLPDAYWNEWFGASILKQDELLELVENDEFLIPADPDYMGLARFAPLPYKYVELVKSNEQNNYLASLSSSPILALKPALVDDPEKCSCREILNAKTQFDQGLISGASAVEIFNTLYGTNLTQTEFDEIVAECCCYYNQGTGCDNPTEPCTLPTEILDESWASPGAPWMAGFDPNNPNSPLVQSGIANNCPPQNEPCTNQMVYLDKCGCDKLIAGYEAMLASNPLLKPDNVDPEQLRLQLQINLGIQLPGGPDYGDLLKKCFSSWANAMGEDANGNVATDIAAGTPRDGNGYIMWDAHNLGKNQLERDAVHENKFMPLSLSCNPKCSSSNEPVRCKYPSCDELRQWYRDFLDANNLESFTWPDKMLDQAYAAEVMTHYQQFGTDKFGDFPFNMAAMGAYLEAQALAAGRCPTEDFNDYFFLLMYKCFRPASWNSVGGNVRHWGWDDVGPNGGVRLWPVKITPCPERCYKVDRTKLEEVKDYLNELLKDKENILHVNNARYFVTPSGRDIPEYYDHFYPAYLLATMKANIRHELTNNAVPQLNFTVTDQNNPGQDRDIQLLFTDLKYFDIYNWRYVKEIEEIDYYKSTTCGISISDDWFTMLVTIEVPPLYVNSYCGINPPPTCVQKHVKMIGRIENLNLHADIDEFSCPSCALLCNKPAVPEVKEDPCVSALNRLATTKAKYRYEMERQRLLREFKAEYLKKCQQFTESFSITYPLQEYQYTLYYYDQADNLIKTVPPEGVHPLSVTEQADMTVYRNPLLSGPAVTTGHELITYYQYNTLNALSWQSTPDGGVSHFWYDKLGRLVLSQNEKQLGQNHYSYTLHDNLGRISEVGEITLASTPTVANAFDDSWLLANITNATAKTQITRTLYEDWLFSIPNFTPENTLSRVVSSLYYEDYTATISDYTHATHYSYDIHGNVKELIQDNPALADFQEQYKKTAYRYDLISGNVHVVAYQADESDQFFHHYTYDANNRLVETYTSSTPMAWDVDFVLSTPQITYSTGWVKESKAYYFPHGPVARRELGEHQIQGVDFSYTLHGWLKTINSGSMMKEHDPGMDAYSGFNAQFGADAFGLELGYYMQGWGAEKEDYTSIRPTTHITNKTGSNLEHWVKNLFNGNISHAVYAIPDPIQLPSAYLPSPRAGRYEYDQLNRLRNSASFLNFSSSGNAWQSNLSNSAVPVPYQENLTYDANGNILSLYRTGQPSLPEMDDMTYNYATIGPNTNKSNQLAYVDDAMSASFAGNYPEDIETQNPGNYTYDAIGNMVSDAKEEIAAIEWTVYGKIKRITRVGGSQKPDLEFAYNSAGQRIMKHLIPNNGSNETYTWYSLDATGNTMAVYETEDEIDGSNLNRSLYASEFIVYGSDRIGMKKKRIDLAEVNYTIDPGPVLVFQNYASLISSTGDLHTSLLGFARYELKNHLGNVMAVVSDRKIGVSNASLTGYDYSIPEVVNLYDYYPFGSPMPERSYLAQECSTSTVTATVTEQESFFEFCSTTLNLVSGFYVLNTSNDDCVTAPTVTQNNDWIADANTTDLVHSGSNALRAEANNGLDPYMVTSQIIGVVATGADYTLEVDLLSVVGSDCYIQVYDNFTGQILNDPNTLQPLVYSTSSAISGLQWSFTMPSNSGDVSIRFVGDPNSFGSFVLLDNYILTYEQVTQIVTCRDLEGYRYGFQGQEKDDEIKGEGNSINYKYRMHDPRIGRFFAVDPLAKKFPHMTPYQFAGNKPVWSREIEGLESEVDAKAGVQINIGNKGNSSIKAFAGVGLTTNTGGSVQGNFGVGLSLYSGGIGTNQGTTGKSSFNLDLNFSAGATGGGGTGTATSVNNYYQGSGISLQNPFQSSFSLGAAGTLSSNMKSQPGRNQVSGYLGAKFGGNTTLSTYNDIFSGPLNKDSYWTGGFEAKSTFGQTSVSLTYDGFTGARPDEYEFGGYPEYQGADGFCYYGCGASENKFNNGQTMLKVSNTNFSFGVGHIGNGVMNGQWLQNAIHDNWPISNPFKWGSDPINRFENSSKESLIFQGGAGTGL